MITEDYVPFEIAKLLREKGFDEKCQKVYMHNGQLLWAQIFMEGESFVNNKCIEEVANYNDWITYTQGEYAYLCPTLQMTCKWILEKYKFFIKIDFYHDSVDSFNSFKWHYSINKLDSYTIDSFNGRFNSPKEAYEAAIKFFLKNLI